MLSAEHCLRRAERLRTVLLCTADPVRCARLRDIVAKYRALAQTAPIGGLAQFEDDLDGIINKARHGNVAARALAESLERHADALRRHDAEALHGFSNDTIPIASNVELLRRK